MLSPLRASISVKRGEVEPGRSRTGARLAVVRSLRNPLVAAGAFVVLLVVLGAVVGPFLSPYSPVKSSLMNRLKPPSATYPLGTDTFGRDVLTRTLFGARISLTLALVVVAITTACAILIGIYATWYPRLDAVIMRVMDVMMSIPSLVLAIALLAFLGGGATNLVIAITLTQIPRSARIVRSAAISLKEGEYVEAARAIGSSDARIMFRHLLPNCLSPTVVNATFLFAQVILIETSLSFIGVGTPPPAPSWGNMLAEGREVMSVAWWLTVVPGMAIVLVVLGLNLLGDGVRDILDPRVRHGR